MHTNSTETNRSAFRVGGMDGMAYKGADLSRRQANIIYRTVHCHGAT